MSKKVRMVGTGPDKKNIAKPVVTMPMPREQLPAISGWAVVPQWNESHKKSAANEPSNRIRPNTRPACFRPSKINCRHRFIYKFQHRDGFKVATQFSSSPPCPAQPQPATATQSAHRNCPAISSTSKLPQRSQTAVSFAAMFVAMIGFDSIIQLQTGRHSAGSLRETFRHCNCFAHRHGLIDRFLEFRFRCRVVDPAAAGLHISLAILDECRADRDAGIEIPVE
jgi:hypothetical protein